MAQLIIESVPSGCELPRGYRTVKLRSNLGSEKFLVKGDPDRADYMGYEPIWVDGRGGFLHGDYNCPVPSASVEDLLDFASDVEDGLIGEIADFLRGLLGLVPAGSGGLVPSVGL